MNIYSFRRETDDRGDFLIMKYYGGNLKNTEEFENTARQISEDPFATFYIISSSMPNYDNHLLMMLENDYREIYCLRECKRSLERVITLEINDTFYIKHIYMRELLIGCNDINEVIQRIIMEAIYGKVFRSVHDYRIKDVPDGRHFVFVLVGTRELIKFDDNSRKKYHHPDLDITPSEENHLSIYNTIRLLVISIVTIITLFIIFGFCRRASQVRSR